MSTFWAPEPVSKENHLPFLWAAALKSYPETQKVLFLFFGLLSYWPKQKKNKGISIVEQLLLSTYYVAGAFLTRGDKEVRDIFRRCHEHGIK